MKLPTSLVAQFIPVAQALFSAGFSLSKYAGFLLDHVELVELDNVQYVRVSISYNPKPSPYTRPFCYHRHFGYDDIVKAIFSPENMNNLVNETLKQVYHSFVAKNK